MFSAGRFARWQKAAFTDVQAAYDPLAVKLFPVPANNVVSLVTIKVTAYSACEHHYAPAFLKATIGYVPSESFIGYSKIVKMFRYFASRYTMDEVICNSFLAEFNRHVEPLGAAVSLRGKHYCVISRGGPESDFPIVNAFTGILGTEASLRAEFLDASRTSWTDGT